MALFDLDGISLMAFASSEVLDQWREEVKENERKKTQTLIENRYTKVAHTNVPHTDVAHTNVAAVDVPHSNTPHVNVAARDSYDKRYSGYRQHSNYNQTYYYYRDASYYNYSQYVQRYYTQRASYVEGYRYYQGTSSTNGYEYKTYTRYYGNGDYAYYYQTHTNTHQGSSHYTRYYKNYSTYYYQLSSNYTAYPVYTQYYYQSYYQTTANYTKYTESLSTDRYSRAAYQQTAHRDVAYRQVPYNQVAYRQVAYRQSAEVNKGFDHTNYIPSAPELYEVEGKVFCDDLSLHLASYDKNQDGYGSQDANSLDIYYIVKIRQIYDLEGNPINSEWKTIIDGDMTEDKDLNISGYPDGIYEVTTQAYNLPRTENGVTATYESGINTFTFTIMNGAIDNDLTIINADEFHNYAYGIDTYLSTNGNVYNYLERVIYSNAPAGQEKGLFLEIDVDATYDNIYHKVFVKLEKGGTINTDTYEVLLQSDSTGKQKAGDKTGVVFIPIGDMLDDGCFDDVNIILKQEVYADQECTNFIIEEDNIIGISQARNVVFVDLDGERPNAIISDPITSNVTKQTVTFTYSDVGKGVGNVFYQIVEAGSLPKADKWIRETTLTGSKTIELTTPGTFDIYVNVVDKVGNEITTHKDNFHVCTAIASLEVPPVAYAGYSFDPIGNVLTDMEITKTEFWLQDYISTQTGELVISQPEGNYTRHTYKTTFNLPDDIPEGVHVVFFKVYLEDGTTRIVSKPLNVKEHMPGTMQYAGVFHTDKWEENRQHFNTIVNPSEQRPENLFWSGEKLMIRAEYHYGGDKNLDTSIMIKSAEILNATKKDGTKYELSFVNYIANKEYLNDLEGSGDTYILKQEGELWGRDMLTRWDGGKNLTIRITFMNGTTQDVEVKIDNTKPYYALHRKL